MRFLVTGATGNVGRLVVRQLAEAGQTVRALTRDPSRANLPDGVEVVRGDLSAPDTLSATLDGVRRMFLFPSPGTAREVVEVAKRAGVERIVTLSSGSVTYGFDTDYHPVVENAVRDSGLDWTFVRPGEFALNRLWVWGPSIRAGHVVPDPFPEALGHLVHELDIADVATMSLLEDGHVGQAYTFAGPDSLTRREQLAVIAATLGQELRLEEVSRERARELYRKQGGFAAAYADFILGYTSLSGQPRPATPPPAPAPMPGSTARPTAEPITGRPARTLAQWCADHTPDFR